ncbi:hypothetical protein BGZ99_003596 [Dissophora globulifera]|uniref:Cytochrome P450 n=1 Tax=Dissophora globulifera TaxID=979702 RepID=A0A9P6RNV7_9FUNG|nr:hypothetical protein BGZ99_003596 [Dissophora globulifera]
MLGLVSNSPNAASFDIIKAALPISIGIASAVYLTAKAVTNAGYGTDKSVPTASLRPGDSTHDKEYNDDQDEFLIRCEEECGPIFNVYLFNKFITVVSGPQIREVFLNESFSAGDAIDEFTNMRTFLNSVRKSNKDIDNRVVHDIVRDMISPNLPLFTPRIVNQLEANLEREMAIFPEEEGRKLVEKPLNVLQEMVASAMATVFMGSEVAKSRKVIDTFIVATSDFGRVLGNGQRHASTWHSIWTRANYTVLNPLKIHLQTLVEAATPIILERRRLEAEATEKGVQWDRPDDIMQRLLDNFDKYGFVDLEDVCGHLLILILASVHTTSDTSTNLLYYMAAFPQHMDKLYAEQQEVLDAIQQEREKERQELVQKGEPIRDDLDPTHDRDLSAAAIKRMVHMDSFVREAFRFRTERLTLSHSARKDITLSSGVKIPKGHSVIINMRSVHQGPVQGDETDEFRPWRFVGKLKSATKVGTDFLPFGMGKHACPGRFLAIQELKTVGELMVSRYSKIEIQDPSKTKQVLLARMGAPTATGLTFTSRK